MTSKSGSPMSLLQQQIFRLENQVLNEKNAYEVLKRENDALSKSLEQLAVPSSEAAVSTPEDLLKESDELKAELSRMKSLHREVTEELEEWQAAFEDSDKESEVRPEDLPLIKDLEEQIKALDAQLLSEKKACESLKEKNEALSTSLDEASSSLSEDTISVPEELLTDLAEKDEVIQKLQNNLSDFSRGIALSERKTAELETELVDLKLEKEKDFEELNSRHQVLKTELSNLEASNKATEEELKEWQALSEASEAEEKEIEEKLSSISDLELKILSLEKEVLNEKNVSKILKEENKSLFTSLEVTSSSLQEAEDSISEETLIELRQKDEKIKSLQESLSDYSKTIAESDKRAIARDAEFTELKLEKARKFDELNALCLSQQDELSSMDAVHKTMHDELEEWRNAFSAYELEEQERELSLLALNEKLDSSEKAKEAVEQSLNSLQDSHERLDEQFSDLEDSYAELLDSKKGRDEAEKAKEETLKKAELSLGEVKNDLQEQGVELQKERDERSSLEAELIEVRQSVAEFKNLNFIQKEKLEVLEGKEEAQRQNLLEQRREKDLLDQSLSEVETARDELEDSVGALNAELRELKKDTVEGRHNFDLNRSVFGVIVSLIILGVLMGFGFKSLLSVDQGPAENQKVVLDKNFDHKLFPLFHFNKRAKSEAIIGISSKRKLTDPVLHSDLRLLTMSLGKLKGDLELELIYPIKGNDIRHQIKAFRFYKNLKKLLKNARISLKMVDTESETLSLSIRLYEES
mgnify:CR=1 FL=1